MAGEYGKTFRNVRSYGGSIISGEFLKRSEVRRRLPYVVFIAFLMLLYIANGYNTQRMHRRYIALSREVAELRTKSLAYTEKRMGAARRSDVIRELRSRGIELQESVTPPRKLE